MNLNFLRTGFYEQQDGFVNRRAFNGHWWSITSGSTTNARYLGTDISIVNFRNSNHRGRGFAVRCVVREG